MQVTVQIHEAWLARPEDLRRVMALLAGLESPPPSSCQMSDASCQQDRSARSQLGTGNWELAT